MMGRTLVVLAALAILALAFLLGREGTMPGTQGDASGAPMEFGYEARDARVTQTADDGSALYELDADRVSQDPGTGTVSARQLTLRYAAAGDPRRWTLTAREAELPGGDSLLRLRGNVRVALTPAGSALPARIATERLDYDSRRQVARTKDDVQIDWGRHRLEARGLDANLKQGLLSLEANVHARFLP
jgi:LPS export ABC transporter protein LptC